MPKVSIILPSLNVIKYIRQTMESVVNQTLQDIEILCVDAGSTDGTLELLQEYEKQDARVKVLVSEKKSYGYQMNMGIRAASGRYIGIVETDDYIEPEMFEVLYANGEEYQADVIKSDFDMFTACESGRRIFIPYMLSKMHKVDYNCVYSCDTYIDGTATIECYIWNALYNKNFLEENHIWFNETPGAAFQDFSFKYRVGFKARRIVAVNQTFYHYRRDNAGSSTYNPRTAEFNLNEAKFLISALDKEKTDIRIYKAAAKEILHYAISPYIGICTWNTPSEGTKAALHEYKELFEGFKEKGYIDVLCTNTELLKGFYLMLKGELYFQGYIDAVAQIERERTLAFLNHMRTLEQIVLYGNGARGRQIYAYLVNNGCKNIVALCDGDESKRNTEEYDVKVISPEDAVRLFPKAFYLLTTTGKVRMAMGELLQKQGIPDENTAGFDLGIDPWICTSCVISQKV